MLQRLLTFQSTVWCIAVLVIAWLLGWPLVMNAWAKSHWNQTACREGAVQGQFMYVVGDKTYISSRRDFWQGNRRADLGVGNLMGPADSTCWVNPTDPHDGVHFLDAPTNWTNAAGRIAASTLIVATVACFLWADRRRRRKQGQEQS